MKKEYKIFKDGTVKEVMTRAIKEGYRILNYKETRQAIKDGKVKDQWYDTATVIIEDEEYNIEMKNADNDLLLKIFNNELKGHVVVLDSSDGGVHCNSNINNSGCFIGVKIKPQEKNGFQCVQCGNNKMIELNSGWVCATLECPNYALIQVMLEEIK